MTGRRAATVLLLSLPYLGLALVFTYPLAWHFSTHYVGEAGGDAGIYLWDFWWIEKSLLELHRSPFATDYVFYPLGIGLSLHTLALLPGLLLIPLQAMAGKIVAVNLFVLWTFVASALGAYALSRELGASPAGAFLGGFIFAFCPYRLARLAGHYDLLSTEWMALYTASLCKALRPGERRWIWVAAAGGSAAACGYTAASYLVFIALLTAAFLLWRILEQRERSRSILLRATGIGVVTAVLLLPYLSRLTTDLSAGNYSPYPGADRYSADVVSYLVPGAAQTLWGKTLGRSFDTNLTETAVFPGYLVLVLAAAGLSIGGIRRSHGFWFVAAGIFFVLSLGSRLRIGGWDTGLPLPFTLFQETPLLEHLRAPARFSILALLGLAVIAAAVWTRWIERPPGPARSTLLTLAVVTLVAGEYLAIPVPLFDGRFPRLYRRIASEPGDFTVLEIPGIDQVPGRIMLHQTIHQKRIFIGTAARIPDETLDYFFGLHLIRPLVDLRKGKIELDSALIDQERDLAPRVARFLGIRYFIVDRSYEKRAAVEFLEKVLPVEVAFEDQERLVLRVDPERLPSLSSCIDPAAEESRMYFASGWSRPEREETESFRWADRKRSLLLLRRPSSRTRRLVISLSPLGEFPQTVEATLDGKSLGRSSLRSGWQELRWRLPPPASPDRVEKLELRWSSLRVASEEDPRRLAARLRAIRLE